MPWVYVLHFDEPLHHAKHYTGSCARQDVASRLDEHASGQGARLTEVLCELGIGWRVGAIGLVTGPSCRKAERILKSQHNVARYCQWCSGRATKRIPGTTPYDPCLIPGASNGDIRSSER